MDLVLIDILVLIQPIYSIFFVYVDDVINMRYSLIVILVCRAVFSIMNALL